MERMKMECNIEKFENGRLDRDFKFAADLFEIIL